MSIFHDKLSVEIIPLFSSFKYHVFGFWGRGLLEERSIKNNLH